ncbi:MAG: hypothetical protein S4CHLAM81_13850 [Chlamydiales bacterium]|nr:hypothetical protein [Chlamydiales bacterium]MCH9636157.1 hypothetical protein [Chlamydiales bacterium]
MENEYMEKHQNLQETPNEDFEIFALEQIDQPTLQHDQ